MIPVYVAKLLLDVYKRQSYYIADESSIGQAVDEIFYSGGEFLTSSKHKNIEIANGGETMGLAGRARDTLENEGFTISKVSTYKGEQTDYTRIVVKEEGHCLLYTSIKISGTGVIPVAMTFLEDKDDGYILQSYKLPEDGEGYAASIKTLFPQELYNRVVHPVSYTHLDVYKRQV